MNELMEIVVLNYAAGTVSVFLVPKKWESENIEEFLVEIGLPANDCYHLIIDGEYENSFVDYRDQNYKTIKV